MKKIQTPRRIEAGTLREAIINHAYNASMDSSVLEGIRHARDLWLSARRHNSLEDTMRKVKCQHNDPDISRITNDLKQSSEVATETQLSPRKQAPKK